MKTINPLFIPLKSVPFIKHTHTESAHNGQLHRMNTYQVWQKVGLRQKFTLVKTLMQSTMPAMRIGRLSKVGF